MIPKAQFTRAVTRFEKAVRALPRVLRVTKRNNAAILEYRSARRELLDLGRVLITGSVRVSTQEAKTISWQPPAFTDSVGARYGAPKTGGI